jgi:hypothetical protein
MTHTHTFRWNERQARALCRCGLREARCFNCNKPVGAWDGTGPLPMCNDQCKAEFDRKTSNGPEMLARLFTIGWGRRRREPK